QPADLLFRGGPVQTAEPGATPASALAVTGQTISWLGSTDNAASWIGLDTQVIELNGRALIPGFADAHIHLESYGAALAQVDLVGTSSYEDVIAAVVARAKITPKGSWITGRGWDQNDWAHTELPHQQALSDAVPDHPVLIERIGGHAVLVNQLAMTRAGFGMDVVSPEGGLIHRDKQRRPTGVLVDNAIRLVSSAIPHVPLSERRHRVVSAIEALHRQGVTSVHDAGVNGEAVAVFAELARSGGFALRSHVMIAADEPLLRAPQSETGWPTNDLTGQGLIAVRAIKLSADGALGSRGAAMLADDSDDDVAGLVTSTPARTLELARFAVSKGWQLCTHAIGDRANREVLDAYSLALAPLGPLEARAALRFRIEHAQILSPKDIPRFAELGVIPSMQAQHLTSDMPWAEERVGPVRIRGAYAWRDLLDSGVIIAGGSDCPVERADPMAAFCAAVTRSDKAGQPPSCWYPAQAMTRDEALAHLTRWPAMAAFDEQRLGSLKQGKLADLVVLSGDLMSAPSGELGALQVDYTVFNGQIVFDRAED
ncbi:MAG: putative amidohydrolase YtcJ, partial [Pseudohongiellaceae bacterium]